MPKKQTAPESLVERVKRKGYVKNTDAPRLCDLVEELATALRGVIAVSDRATVEYDRARAALEKVKQP